MQYTPLGGSTPHWEAVIQQSTRLGASCRPMPQGALPKLALEVVQNDDGQECHWDEVRQLDAHEDKDATGLQVSTGGGRLTFALLHLLFRMSGLGICFNEMV